MRGVYGTGKTKCISLLEAWFALKGHRVYYAARENTTVRAMADFVHRLLPRGEDDQHPRALRLSSGSQAQSHETTGLDALDSDNNQVVWGAKFILATTGLHLS